MFAVKASLGKEIAHPNITEHHIRWSTFFFQPEGERFAYRADHHEFSAHGESVEGANQGPVYTRHEVATSLKISKPDTIYAMAYRNIHELWQSAKEVRLI